MTAAVAARPVRVADAPLPADPAELTGPRAHIWKWIQAAAAGDREAFGRIYGAYHDSVFKFIYFRTSHRQLAEDLTADTFVRALNRIDSFTWQGRDLGAWLITIARNLVADHYKSGRYRLEVLTGEVLAGDHAEFTIDGVDEAVVDYLTNVEVMAALKTLGAEQRECLVLRFLLGFSVEETAQAMGKNEGAIKALQYRATRAMTRALPKGFRE